MRGQSLPSGSLCAVSVDPEGKKRALVLANKKFSIRRLPIAPAIAKLIALNLALSCGTPFIVVLKSIDIFYAVIVLTGYEPS